MTFLKATGAPTLGMMSRVGLGIGALAAVLAALAPSLGDLVRGPARAAHAERVATFDGSFVPIAVLCALVLAAAVVIPRLWAGFTGIVVATIIAFASGREVWVARTSKEFAADADLVLLGGGKALVAAATIGMAAVIITLVGVRRDTPVPADAPAAGAGPRNAPRALVALGVAVAGFLVGVLGPLGIALGVIALNEVRGSGGRLRGQGFAIAAIALGILGYSLWIALITSGMLSGSPA
jgi:hypothetical protein